MRHLLQLDEGIGMRARAGSRSKHHAASQHRPTAIDWQVDAGDLARNIAGEKQASIGDVGIAGDALKRVIRSVALGSLVDGDPPTRRAIGSNLVPEPRA